jgi:biopolymer transport protein ExbD
MEAMDALRGVGIEDIGLITEKKIDKTTLGGK